MEVAGVTIPRGATLVLLLASGNRDPARFHEADRFVPDREDNQHLAFGGGAHYCVGAPLARIALSDIARRPVSPGSSPTRRPTGKTPPCAAPSTFSSGSIACWKGVGGD